MIHVHLLSDQPLESAAEDGLGFAPFVESLRRALEGTQTPFVYGLLGDWGSGRTSALRLLEARLRQECEAGASALVPVWLNASQYENDVNLIYPLLYALRQAYQGDRRITALAGGRGFGGMFARVAATSALAAADVALRGATRNLAGEALPARVDPRAGGGDDQPLHLVIAQGRRAGVGRRHGAQSTSRHMTLSRLTPSVRTRRRGEAQ